MTPKVKPRTIVIAKIIKPHGVCGGVKVKPFTETLDDFYLYDVFTIEREGEEESITVQKIQPLNGLLVIYFKGVDSLEQAEKLRDMLIHLPRETIIAKKGLSSDDILIDDLVGFEVCVGETFLGHVNSYYEGGTNGLYLVKVDSKLTDEEKNSVDEKDFFIPCDIDFYRETDLYQKKIFLHPNSVVR